MISVRRGNGPPLRIGHRGAAALAPENTLASFDAAIACGVDFVEFDVLALHDGTLVLAHSADLSALTAGRAAGGVAERRLRELRRLAPALATLEEALEHLASHSSVGLHLDLKTPGHERAVVASLARHGAVGRTLVTSVDAAALRRLAGLEPELRLGLSYPLDRWGLARRRVFAPAALAALAAARASLPRRIGPLLARAGATVAALQHLVVTRAVVERSHALGAAVFAWTVDDLRTIRRLAEAGVDGIITNDPRLFRGDVTT